MDFHIDYLLRQSSTITVTSFDGLGASLLPQTHTPHRSTTLQTPHAPSISRYLASVMLNPEAAVRQGGVIEEPGALAHPALKMLVSGTDLVQLF